MVTSCLLVGHIDYLYRLSLQLPALDDRYSNTRYILPFVVMTHATCILSFPVQCQSEFCEKHNVHPLKSLVVVLTQIPVWITMSLTLRTMTGYFGSLPQHGFLTEGGPWFQNLAATDSTLVLPIAFGKSRSCR